MGFFSRKPENYLGVDIGAGGIKVVELRSDKHRARLSTYGFADVVTATENPASNLSGDLGETSAILREIHARAHGEATRAVASLPIAAVFSSIISLPRMGKKELPAAVAWEAKKIVPLPIEDMILDWKLLTPESELTKKDGASTIRVLLTGAAKSLVGQYLTVFKQAKLELVSLETEAFALIRSLVGDDPSVVLILDIGAARTSMVVVDDGVPVLSRGVDVGGNHITAAIANALGTSADDAEQVKLDLAVAAIGNPAAAALPAILANAVAPVVQEVRYGMNLYLSQESARGRVVEKIILAGGSALLPGITEIFAQALDLRVFVGDPWARVIYPVDLRPTLDAIGPRFAVSVGLAMREIH
ncbi:type IV pilus assembly protein PilM [Candidatus Uhrbacteria bacterium]|nr:type IV pilus assembly protein PilM [Candidatus Uhrbacteria bacterium]